jgi:uncharacterized protein
MRTAPLARTLVALTLTLAAAACREPAPPPGPAYIAELDAWKAERLAGITAEGGWLTVVGLHWVKPGTVRLGAAPGNDIVLAGTGVPAEIGILEVGNDGTAVLRPAAGVQVMVAGKGGAELVMRSDRAGGPDVATVGSLRFHLIDRAGSLALRVKDLDTPARKAFRGLQYFPVDTRLKVEGWFEPYEKPRKVAVPSAHGPDQAMLAAGLIRFTVAGTACALEVFGSRADDQEFFIVFRDRTAGKETYGAGRFLDARAPGKGPRKAEIDFNRATNPPCAFTAYATCPLPPPQNELPVRIEAGEMVPATH